MPKTIFHINQVFFLKTAFGISIFVFFFTFVIYNLTLSKSVYFGDSGEFIAVAKTLGITHPPGYPLYTILAHLFTYLPIDNLAQKINLFSTFTSSLTATIIFLICLKITKNQIASLVASLSLAFSYHFWLYSLVAEVFSLNNFFLAAILLLCLLILENPNKQKHYFLLAFVFGLSLTNHHTIILIVPALIFLIFRIKSRQLLNPSTIGICILLFVVGLSPYIYLPIRALQNPVLNWGDPDTPAKFFHHIARKDYGTFSFGASTANSFNLDILKVFFTSSILAFAGIGWILAILGFLSLYRQKTIFFFLTLAFLFFGPIFIFYTRVPTLGNISFQSVLERFFIASGLIIAIFLAQGVAETIKKTPKNLYIPANLLLLLVFVVPLIFNFPKVNQSNNFIYEEFGRTTLENLPQESVVLLFGDRLSMISKYMQVVQNLRPDIKIINITLITDNWYKESLKKIHPDFSFPYDKFQYLKLTEVEAGQIICQEILPNYPTFIETRTKGFEGVNNRYCTNRPYKNLWKLEPKNYEISEKYLTEEYEKFWHPLLPNLTKNPPDLRTRSVLLFSYSYPLTELGRILTADFKQKGVAFQIHQDALKISKDNAIALYLSSQKYLDEKDYETAKKQLIQSTKIDPTFADPHKTLGLVYLDFKQDEKTALKYFKKYLRHAPDAKDKEQIKKTIIDLEQKLNQ